MPAIKKIIGVKIERTEYEYVVRTYVAGPNGQRVRYPRADYYAGGLSAEDKLDAIQTAEYLLKNN